MDNWFGPKSVLLKMSLKQKRDFYKCGDDFRTINDILDWGKYSEADEAKLAASEIGEASIKKDVETAVEGGTDDLAAVNDSHQIDSPEKKTGSEEGNPVSGNVSPRTDGSNVRITTNDNKSNADVLMETDQDARKRDGSSEKVDTRDETVPFVADIGDFKSNADVQAETDQDARKKDGSSEKADTRDETVLVAADIGGDISDLDVKMETDQGARKKDGSSEKADTKTVSPVAEKVFAKNEFLNGKISLFTGDITCLEIDAIVNAANDALICGGGVDNAIHSAAGRSLLEAECRSLNGCDTGDAKITGGYHLPAKYVIHAVGPRGEHPDLLASCYKKAMDLMKEHKLETIAFPCISTGIYGYPNERAAAVALQTIREWLDEDEYSVNVKRVIFCLFLQRDIKIYHKLMPKYFPF